MPPSLHPRSRLTTSLFGTTLLISFLVVGMPHIIPCPAPRVAFAEDEISDDGRKRRRRRRQKSLPNQSAEESEEETAVMPNEWTNSEKKAHECPVPKPRGLVGEMLGFGRREKEAARPRVLVEAQKEDRRQQDGE